LLFAWTFYLLLLALRSARPEAGLFGAIAVAVDAGWLARETSLHIAAQAGFVFLLIHSLRWRDDAHAGARFLRYLAASLWTLDAIVWTRNAAWLEAGVTSGAAMSVWMAWLLVYCFRKQRDPLIIPIAAGIALLSGPGNWFARHGSDGLLAVLGSLVLFAAGVAVAWTRHRWERRESAGRD
jgi:hypothetical protein